MATTYTYKKDAIGANDIKFKASGTARATWNRVTSDGSTTQTINQVDAGDLQFRSLAKQIEDLIDGGFDVSITPLSCTVGGGHLNLYSGYNFKCYTDAGSTLMYDLDSADGSVAHTISNDKYVAITKTESDLDTVSWTGYYQDPVYSNYFQPAHVVDLTVTHNDGGVSGADANWTCCYLARNDVNLNSGTGHRYDNRCMGFIYHGHLQSPVYDGGALRSFILMDSTHAYTNLDDKCDADVVTWTTKVDGTSKMWAAFSEGVIEVENCGTGSSGNIGLHHRIRVHNDLNTDKDTKDWSSYGIILENMNGAVDGITYDEHYAEYAFWPRGRWKSLIFTQNNYSESYDANTAFADCKIGEYAISLRSILYDTNAEAMCISSGSKIVLDGTAYNATHNYYISDDISSLGTLCLRKGTDIASAAEITLGDGSIFDITGTADITSIAAASAVNGRIVILQFDGTKATNGLVNGSNLELAGTLAYTPLDTIMLYCDGSSWFEISRSVNS